MPVLRREDEVYVHAFRAYAIARTLGHSIALGSDVFQVILEHEDLRLGDKEIQNAVFDAYWDLAEDEGFWQPGCHGEIGLQLPYEQALHRWDKNNGEHARKVEEGLRQWLNGN